MESTRILVAGLPEGTTEADLTIYFQSERDSGGGDVKKIEIDHDRDRAKITFESVEATVRILKKRKHTFQGKTLEVALLPDIDPAATSEYEEEASLESNESEEWSDGERLALDNRFGQNTKEKSRAEASVPASPSHASFDSKENHSELTPSGQQRTVLVKGISPDVTEDLLTDYFENARRSKGGPVSRVDIYRDQSCHITFESPDDALRTVKHSPHKLGTSVLEVSLIEPTAEELPAHAVEQNKREEYPSDETEITIVVSGILPSEDAICDYFENKRKSGGGEILKNDFNDEGDYVITFAEVKDLKRLLEGPHSIESDAPVKVTRRPPKKKFPLDPLRLHVKGVDETRASKAHLQNYLEKFADADVQEDLVYFGCNNNALVTFETEPDFTALFEKVHKDTRGLQGSKLELERVPKCTCVQVSGLEKETPLETIQLYFESAKWSGGDSVADIKREEKSKDRALVYFDDPATVQNVIKRSQALGGKELEVKPYYPFLENKATKQAEVSLDADVFHYIKEYHEEELQTVLEENKVEVEISGDSGNSIITLFPSGKKGSYQLWQERVGHVELFLKAFIKIEVPIEPELFDEITRRWKEHNSTQDPSNYSIDFNAPNRLAQIVGKNHSVKEEEIQLKELIHVAEKDTELMKSVVDVVEPDIQWSRLVLLRKSGICERLQSCHPHLSISFDVDGGKLFLKGPVSLLQEVRLEVYKFVSKVIEQTVELPTNLIKVLKRPQISNFTQDLLKHKGIQALFVYDESKDLNEVQVVGVGPQSVADAEVELKNVIQEKSLHLTRENALVLDSRRWKEFRSEVISTFKVGIFAEPPSSTVWVSGIADDVEECYDKVKDFFDANTILHDTLPLDHGTTRFIFEKWSSKLDGIKKELSHCCLNIKASPDVDGIAVSGTADGLKKCMPKLQDLAKAVREDKVLIDKPGMKNLFLQGKGPGLLKTIEDKNHCVILTKERNGSKMPALELKAEEVKSSSKFICSYLTQEGKKISVFKGDITKHRVDAIVNPANMELQHSGGLARAIVLAGGQEIQDECNEFTRDGNVLLVGRTMVTRAGMLPCDKVIHTVGPKWETDEREEEKHQKELELNYAIKNCLVEAKSMRSIAIPAVSSGVYRFPRDLCARVILSAVINFCKENPLCLLSEIHLVNIDDPTVSEFEKEMRKRFASEMTFTDNEISGFAGFGVLKASKRARRSPRMGDLQALETPRTARYIPIKVKVADIAAEEVDILVGTAASSLNLEQNPCAHALSQAAGPSLQQQCTKKGPLAEGDIAVIEQTGKLKCKAVIFAVCPQWDGGKGMKVLKGLLTKCLEEADKKNAKSIAFPAIGTGILRFPSDKVAEAFFDEVLTYSQNKPNTKLQEVRFVLYDKDANNIQAFHSEERKKSIQSGRKFSPRKSTSSTRQNATSASPIETFSPVKERKLNHLETVLGTLCFHVQPGDITQDTTDAIGVIADRQLNIGASAAGSAILKAGGNSIKAGCSRNSPKSHGSVTVINAGNLMAKHIYLIVPTAGDLTGDKLKAAVLQCLQEAEKRGISSISFPAIGTGNLGISAKCCARSMLSAIRELGKQKPESLQLVKMSIFQEHMIKDFRIAMDDECTKENVAKPGFVERFVTKPMEKVGDYFRGGGNRSGKTTPETNQEIDQRKVELIILAGCDRDLQSAINEVNAIMRENCKEKPIIDPLIGSLTKEHMHTLHTLELRYDVKVTVEKAVNRIVLNGQSDDIFQVMDKVYAILHEVKREEDERSHAEALSVDVQWMFKTAGAFKEYDSTLNAQIELAYHKKKPCMEFEKDGDLYQIDFYTMTQEDTNNDVIEVRRVDLSKEVVFPVYWCPQPTDQDGQEETVHLFKLDPTADAQEYRKVSDEFLKSSPGKKIIMIERVQNPALYETYTVNKKRMEKARGSNEMYLFHGTKGSKCELINHKGFNRSFCGENGTVYGFGVYFAVKSSYSARDRYSPPDDEGHRYMYLAKVLVGEYTKGKDSLRTPPPRDDSNVTDTYDTVVDNVSTPSIVVVFYDWQCYPEYLITFQ